MTYTQLLANVQFWTKRSDLGAYLPTFVQLVEARINRELRAREMEAEFTLATIDGDNLVALPADFGAIKSLWPVSQPESPVSDATLEQVITDSRGAAMPTRMHIGAESIRFNGSGDVQGVYYARIPTLASSSSNWLSLKHPDLYLFGCVSEAFAFMFSKEDAALWGGRFEAVFGQVSGADKRDRHAGPLTARKG